MNKIQFLILAIAAIPLLNCLLLKLYQNDFIDKFCAILFFACTVGAYNKLGEKASYLSLIQIEGMEQFYLQKQH